MKRMMTWPLTWLVQLWYIKIWPLTWLVQLWHITIWPLTWLVQLWKALLAYINQEFVAIKWNCLEGTPVSLIVSHSPKGWVGRQQAHLSSGPLGFGEGSSTASLFLRSTPPHQRDGMGKEVGGGFRSGNLCTPMVDSRWSMAKPIQYCKVKK